MTLIALTKLTEITLRRLVVFVLCNPYTGQHNYTSHISKKESGRNLQKCHQKKETLMKCFLNKKQIHTSRKMVQSKPKFKSVLKSKSNRSKFTSPKKNPSQSALNSPYLKKIKSKYILKNLQKNKIHS